MTRAAGGLTYHAVPEQAIENAPTIDAVPVVHARWKRDEEYDIICTACGSYLPSVTCYSEGTFEYWDEQIDETPFCPNCGAKMDGGAENG